MPYCLKSSLGADAPHSKASGPYQALQLDCRDEDWLQMAAEPLAQW
jgi:hypothetical protein